MTKEEYYHIDPQSGESVASLQSEWLEEDKKEADDIRHDIARTLEGIDTIVQNRYLDSVALKPVQEILHTVEDRLIFLEATHDPNRMDSLRDLDPEYSLEIAEKLFVDDYEDIFSADDLKLIRQLIDDDAAYLDFLLKRHRLDPEKSYTTEEDERDYNEETNYGCF